MFTEPLPNNDGMRHRIEGMCLEEMRKSTKNCQASGVPAGVGNHLNVTSGPACGTPRFRLGSVVYQSHDIKMASAAAATELRVSCFVIHTASLEGIVR